MWKRFSIDAAVLRPLLPTGPTARRDRGSSRIAALLGSLLLVASVPTAACSELLRVGTSGDYAPFSVRGPDPGSPPTGFAPDVARAFAADRGLELEFVPFAWPELLADLETARFDVAMGGITVRPERSIAGIFTVPVATSGAVALVPQGSGIMDVAQLDRPGRRIAVNAGGHLERVARTRFPRAQVLAIPDNERVLAELRDGRADAVVTDTGEAPHWIATSTDLRVLGPFTRDRKAFLVRPGRGDLAAELDAWLLAAEADGTLTELRSRAFGTAAAAEPTASVLASLLAAIDERLALMPDVAEAKRASGSPVEVPEREAVVVDAAVDGVRRARAPFGAAGAVAADTSQEAAVRALFLAQIEAAKQIQKATLARAPAPASPSPPDLDQSIRPALIRIGDRIARLIVALPADLDPAAIHTAVRRELAARNLDDARLDAIASAIVAISRSAAAEAEAETPTNRAVAQ